MISKILIGLGIVVALVVVAAVAVPFFIPADAYVGKVAEAVKQATGRDLKIAGPVSFHLLPDIALVANGVSLSNAPGDADAEFVTIGKLDVGLKLMPLLSKRVEISHLTLNQPVIHLESDKQGQGNWVFKPATPAAPAPKQPAQAAVSAQKGDVQAQLQQLSLGTIKIVDGTLTYLDDKTGKKQQIAKLEATLSIPSINDKISLNANADWNGQTITVDIDSSAAGTLLGGGDSTVTIKIASSLFKLAVDGKAKLAEPLVFNGTIDLSSPSVRNLAAWTGTPLKMTGSGLGPLSLKAKLAIANKAVTLSDTQLSLDAIKASGTLGVNANGTKPAIKGNLQLGALDLNPYLGGNTQPGQAQADAAPPAAPTTAGTGWSEAPIDASALKLADVDLTLDLTSLKFHTFDIGKTDLALVLANGRLNVNFKQLTLYGGGGTGHIALDGSNPGLGFETGMALSGVQMQALLNAAVGVSKVTGTGNVNIELTAHGRNQAELMQGLAGKGGMRIANGAIKGIDLVAIEHKPLQGLTESSSTAETTFTGLSGTFVATGGVFNNQDLLLESPSLGLTGKGSIDMFHRTLSYRVEPNLPGGIQGGKSGIYGTAVPIIIDGPWTHLSYRPDVQAVLQQKAQKAIGGQLDKLLGKNGSSSNGGNSQASGLLKGLLGH